MLRSEREVQEWLKTEAADRKARARQEGFLRQGMESLERAKARKAAARKGSLRGAVAMVVAVCLKMFGA